MLVHLTRSIIVQAAFSRNKKIQVDNMHNIKILKNVTSSFDGSLKQRLACGIKAKLRHPILNLLKCINYILKIFLIYCNSKRTYEYY